MSASLKGKVAVVTGGSAGIGLAAAKRLAADGVTVFITGRRQAELDKAIAEIGGDAVAVQADVSKPADLDRLYETVRSTKGRLDIVVANAGLLVKEPLGSITEEALEYQLSVNFKGAIYTVQKALPLLSQGASVILASSTVAVKGVPGSSVYAATKAAIRNLARTWTQELRGRGIRVNVFSPGPIDTPGMRESIGNQAGGGSFKAAISAAVPMGRFGEAEEMAEVIAFLASDASSYISGADIQADGGWAQV
jgi:NAD(P)-dependent dehydrogenase (short-subunit alcohol dehydrogenase family)